MGVNWAGGFVPPHGDGSNGVLVVDEAPGEDESREGLPLIGKPGYFLWEQLKRAGVTRDGFRVHDMLSCRPPDNKLLKMPYERGVLTHCQPNIQATIDQHWQDCRTAHRVPVIVALGKAAFRGILGLGDHDSVLKGDYKTYPFPYRGGWVLGTDRPNDLMRGKHNLTGALQFVFQRALEIAQHGLTPFDHRYVLDPEGTTFRHWVGGFVELWHQDPNLELSYDIETPYKVKVQAEDDLSGDTYYGDHTILRVSFSYMRPDGTTRTVSVKWDHEHMDGIKELFSLPCTKLGWNNNIYDDPRVRRHVTFNGVSIDAMVAWHVLNSALPKTLGFVTPFYVQNTEMWKHLSDTQPSFYNAKDADMALRVYRGVLRDLKGSNLWGVFERYVLTLDKALAHMTSKGLILDQEMRTNAEHQLTTVLADYNGRIQSAVPVAARNLKVYRKTPALFKGLEGENLTLAASAAGMVEVAQSIGVKYCGVCGLLKPTKTHLKHCPDSKPTVIDEPQVLWAKVLPFKVSNKSMQAYQRVVKHQPILSRKERKVTFDEEAIMRLMRKYPKDPMYASILGFRQVQKLLGTYVGVTQPNGRIKGGMPVGADGRIHTTLNHNPSTLRLGSQDPNLQNLPRPDGNPEALVNIIRNLIVAGDGNILLARDFSGIEAVLVGWEAKDPGYIRLAKHDVHTFYTMYGLYELEGRFLASDLPELSWPDDKLFPYLAHMKSVVKHERNSLYKHLVHGANYWQSPKGAAEKIYKDTGVEYPTSLVGKVMGVYFSLFPSIPRWHGAVLEQADTDGYLTNAFGMVHRFNKVYDYVKECGRWIRKPGPDANKVIAFRPQSNAAAIIFEAIIRLYLDRFDEAGQYLRLQVHDECFLECPVGIVDDVDAVVREVMESPIPQLTLPASYGMGEYLTIDTEAKRGNRWGGMH